MIPPHNGAPTSRAAANEIEPVAGKARDAVLDYLRSRGGEGATADEIEKDTLFLRQHDPSPAGRVEADGKRPEVRPARPALRAPAGRLPSGWRSEALRSPNAEGKVSRHLRRSES